MADKTQEQEEWRKRALAADKQRKIELNRQALSENNGISSYVGMALGAYGAYKAGNFLMHRTGLHKAINKPLYQAMKAAQGLSTKSSKPWHTTTLSDWKAASFHARNAWYTSGKEFESNPLRININGNSNSFFQSMIGAHQMSAGKRQLGEKAWRQRLNNIAMRHYKMIGRRGFDSPDDINRQYKFETFISHIAHNVGDRNYAYAEIKKTFKDENEIKLANKYADWIEKINRRTHERAATKSEIATMGSRVYDKNGVQTIVASMKDDFIEKHNKRADAYIKLLNDVDSAAKHFGTGNNISLNDKIRGTRKATMQDILDNIDQLQDIKVATSVIDKDGKSRNISTSLADIVQESYQQAVARNKGDVFKSITPDANIRIDSKGNLYSSAGTDMFQKSLMENLSTTLPGKILKIRDINLSNNTPTFNLSLKGSVDPILAAASNNSIESRKSEYLDNDIFMAYGRWYKFDRLNGAHEIEHMRDNYRLTSGVDGFAYKQIELMANRGRRIESDNFIKRKLDLRTDRDEFENKTIWSKLKNRLPFSKDEFSPQRILEDIIDPNSEAISRHTRGLQAIENGDFSYAYDTSLKIDKVLDILNENTYELSSDILDALSKKVDKKSMSGRILKILRETDDERFINSISDFAEEVTDNDERLLNTDFKGWLNRFTTDRNRAVNEYQVITGRTHGNVGTDFSSEYGKESMQKAKLIRKRLGKEFLMQLGSDMTTDSKLKRNSYSAFEDVYELLEGADGVLDSNKRHAKDLATDTFFEYLFRRPIRTSSFQNSVDDAQDYASALQNFAENEKGYKFVDKMKESLDLIKKENLSSFDTYYNEASEVGNPLSMNKYVAIRKTTGVLDVLKQLNEDIRNGGDLSKTGRAFMHMTTQFTAGRDSMADVSYGTLSPYFMLTRLNEVGQLFGIGFSSESMGSSIDIARNIMTKRVIPASILATYAEWGDDTVQEVTGQSVSAAAARGAAQTDVAIRRGMDAIGLTDWLKQQKEINPIMQYWGDQNEFYNADELQDYYDNGYTPVRKGAYWTFGSVNEFRGSEISYWAPTLVRRLESDYKDKALYDGYFDKWSHSLLPTPSNPLSPILGVLDPYWLEEKHADDRPYAVSGQLFDEGTPLGIILNPTIGRLIKPQKELHPWRLRNGVDIMSALHAANQVIRDKAASIGERQYFTYDRMDTVSVAFNAWNAPTEDTSVMSFNFSNGGYGNAIAQTYGVYNAEEGEFNTVTNGGAGFISSNSDVPGSAPLGSQVKNLVFNSGIPSFFSKQGFTPINDDNGSVVANTDLDKDHVIVSDAKGKLGLMSREQKPDYIDYDKYDLDIAEDLEYSHITEDDRQNIRGQGARLIKMAKDPIKNLGVLNNNIRQKAAKINSISANDFDENQGFLTAQKLKNFAPSKGMELLNDADTVAELLNQGKGSSLIHDMAVSERLMTGIYGYATGEAFGIGTDQEKRLATSQDITSGSRAFWDTGFGGLGGSTAEIIRRFIPDYRRNARINPLLNEMPDWLPDKFKYGDAYTSLIDGEARLPGKGYEALNELHPDQFGEYGAFDRMKILADIAPFSPEYKLWKQIAAKTVTDQKLLEEMDEIRNRVAQQGKKHEFYNYNVLGKNVEYREVVVSELMGYGKFKSGDEVYKLAGISIQTNGQTSMKDTLGKYLRVGDTVTIAVDANEAYGDNRDTQGSVNAAVFRDGENVSKQMLEAGDARVRKGDNSAAASVARYDASQRVIAKASELIAHIDVPWLSDQYLRVRSPLESYEAEQVYGTTFQSWGHPIDSMIMPALERAAHERNFLQINMVNYLFNNMASAPGVSKMGKWGYTATWMLFNRGAFIGGALGTVAGFRQSTVETGARIGSGVMQAAHILTGGNSYLDMTVSGAELGYEIAKKFERNKKVRLAAAIAGAVSADGYRLLFGDENDWIPERQKKKWALQEYFDRLTYIKYEALYHEAARRAKEEEDVDVEEIVERQKEEYEKADEKSSKAERMQKELKKLTYDKNSPMSTALKKRMQGIINDLEQNQEVFEGGEWTKTALLYRKAAKATVYAMNKDTSWAQMISALPTNDKEYFMEFVKEKDESKRDEILNKVSPALQKALRLAWKKGIEKQVSNEEYFKTHYLPTASWEGWTPDRDIDDVEIKTIANEGMLLSDFGYYESALREDDMQKVAAIQDWDKQSAIEPDTAENLKRVLQAQGLKDVDISVEPGVGSTTVIASIKRWAGFKEVQERVDNELQHTIV